MDHHEEKIGDELGDISLANKCVRKETVVLKLSLQYDLDVTLLTLGSLSNDDGLNDNENGKNSKG